MPSSTLFRVSDLVAHVPVDKFDIVNGPSPSRCLQLMEELRPMWKTDHEPTYVEQLFTLTTPASASAFRRNLRLATVFDVQQDGSFTFTAIFNGRIVSGIYSPHTRKGWFNLD